MIITRLWPLSVCLGPRQPRPDQRTEMNPVSGGGTRSNQHSHPTPADVPTGVQTSSRPHSRAGQSMRLSLTRSLPANPEVRTQTAATAGPNSTDSVGTELPLSRPASQRTLRATSEETQHPPAYEEPVQELTEEQAKLAISTMLQNLEGWTYSLNNRKEGDQSQATDDALHAWNHRVFLTKRMLDTWRQEDLSNHRIFAYHYRDEVAQTHTPIGIAIVYKEAGFATVLNALVTHPGSQKAGGLLMERAVDAAEEAGTNGKLILASLEEDTVKVYEAWGFKELDPGTRTMLLDPSRSVKWTQRSGKWRLESRVNKNLERSRLTQQ